MRVPESRREASGDSGCHGLIVRSGMPVFEDLGPSCHLGQGVVPQRVDFDGFANPWGDHPVPHLGVHPRELHSGLTGEQQAVQGIDTKAVTGSAAVPVDDVAQRGIQIAQQRLIVRGGEVGRHRMEIPQCRVDRVVLGFLAAIRKAVRQHSLAHVRGKGAQDCGRVLGPPGGERQARQRDHGIAPPVAEPRIACDNGRSAQLAARRRAAHDELIGRERQSLDPIGRPRGCCAQQ